MGGFPPIAQLVERLPFKEMVIGSNPIGRTNDRNLLEILCEASVDFVGDHFECLGAGDHPTLMCY
jgi:hypothetical protein